MDKLYRIYDNEDLRGTFSIFAEAVYRAWGLDKPVITCFEMDRSNGFGTETWRAVKRDGLWWQVYADGKEREVDQRMQRLYRDQAALAKTGERPKG